MQIISANSEQRGMIANLIIDPLGLTFMPVQCVSVSPLILSTRPRQGEAVSVVRQVSWHQVGNAEWIGGAQGPDLPPVAKMCPGGRTQHNWTKNPDSAIKNATKAVGVYACCPPFGCMQNTSCSTYTRKP